MRKRRPLPKSSIGSRDMVRSPIFRRLRCCVHKLLAFLEKNTTLMSRAWDPKKFDSIYAEFIQQNAFAVHYGSPNHYSRYRSRYKSLVKRFCSLAPATPVDVLDIGGGQLALLCKPLWADNACVADLNIRGPLFDYLRSQKVPAVQWNLYKNGTAIHRAILTSSSFQKLLSIYHCRVMWFRTTTESA